MTVGVSDRSCSLRWRRIWGRRESSKSGAKIGTSFSKRCSGPRLHSINSVVVLVVVVVDVYEGRLMNQQWNDGMVN